MKSFNKKEYINKWKKENTKRFFVNLHNEEFEELDKLLKYLNMTRKEFVLNAKKEIEEKIKLDNNK